MAELEELLKKKEKIEAKLAEIKLMLGHPHLDFMSAHEIAETEFKVYSAYLDGLNMQITKLENEKLRQKGS